MADRAALVGRLSRHSYTKPAQRTHPAKLVQLVRLIKQPVVRRPVHAVRLLRFVRTVIASELPPDALGSEHRPVGVAQALAVEGRTAEDARRHQLSGRRQRVRRGLPRPAQEREAARPGPCAPRSVARLLGSSDRSGLEAPSQAARRRPRRGRVGSAA